VLPDSREVGHDNRGTYVDDRRYGRVLTSWDAFVRVDLSRAGSGPAYGDFHDGSPSKPFGPAPDDRKIAASTPGSSAVAQPDAGSVTQLPPTT